VRDDLPVLDEHQQQILIAGVSGAASPLEVELRVDCLLGQVRRKHADVVPFEIDRVGKEQWFAE